MNISIVIPTYNRKKLLARCVKSILGQTMTDFEIVIVDDGSTDGSEQYIRATFDDPRIRYIRLPQNRGAYVARNRGIEEARGDFFMYWDSDDELYPQALQTLLDVLDAHPEVNLVTALSLFLENQTPISFPAFPEGRVTYVDYIRSHTKNIDMWLMRRATFLHLRYCAPNLDFVFNHRVAKLATRYHLNRVLGIHYMDADVVNETKQRRTPNIEKSILRGRCLVSFLREFKEDMVRYCPERYGGLLYGAALGLLLDGQRQDAAALAKEAWVYDPMSRHRRFYWFSRIPGSPTLLRWSFRIKRFLLKMK